MIYGLTLPLRSYSQNLTISNPQLYDDLHEHEVTTTPTKQEMPRYAQLVMGPAGAGKSTYVNTVEMHYATLRRKVHCINLDPAAEHFAYPVQCDIRELISVDDVMEDNEMRLVIFEYF